MSSYTPHLSTRYFSRHLEKKVSEYFEVCLLRHSYQNESEIIRYTVSLYEHNLYSISRLFMFFKYDLCLFRCKEGLVRKKIASSFLKTCFKYSLVFPEIEFLIALDIWVFLFSCFFLVCYEDYKRSSCL